MNSLHDWFARNQGKPLDLAVFRDLQLSIGTYTPPLPAEAPGVGKSEAWAQSMVRIEASAEGIRTFRNNVGVLQDKTGRPVRYGLANDSAQLNGVLKSGDLIGIKPVIIKPWHVGHTLGQFWSRECKKPGWQYSGNEHEVAQMNWCNLINSCGGDAAFTTGPSEK